MTDQIFVVPPGWPRPPEGWEPPADWRPDPGWPPAPPGWQFWQTPQLPPRPDLPLPAQHSETGRLRRENAALRAEVHRLETAVEASNAELRRVLGADPALVRAETERMLRDRDTAQIQLQTTLAQLAAAQRQMEAAADAGRWVT